MRKHVRPADKNAIIPDPERGRDLPAEGLEVTWSIHWERLRQRGDIKVKDVEDDPKKPSEPDHGTIGSAIPAKQPAGSGRAG